MVATKFATLKDAEAYIKALASKSNSWTRSVEHMGLGTDSHRAWETFSIEGVKVLEIRWGTPDAGVYRLD